MTKSKHGLGVFIVSSWLGALACVSPAGAQDIQPELSVGARAVTSAGVDIGTDPGAAEEVAGVLDFSDTALLVRGQVQLFNEWLGGSLIGIQFPDSDSNLGVLFVHQANVFLQAQWLDIRAGRTRIQSSILEIPTLRDDDFLPYSDTLNPFATGQTTEDHQYGNVVEATVNYESQYFLAAHAEHLFLTPGDGGSVDFSLNSYGATLAYRSIPARADQQVVRTIGAGINYYDVPDDTLAPVWNVMAGAALNVSTDPVHLLDARAQVIYAHGDGSTVLADANSTYRTRNVRGALTLRYQYTEAELPKLQVALMGGYARYFQGAGGEETASLALNGFYNLGYGFQIGAQYQVSLSTMQIRAALGTPEVVHRAELALVFSYELVVNRLPIRSSILNVEHGYIP